MKEVRDLRCLATGDFDPACCDWSRSDSAPTGGEYAEEEVEEVLLEVEVEPEPDEQLEVLEETWKLQATWI